MGASVCLLPSLLMQAACAQLLRGRNLPIMDFRKSDPYAKLAFCNNSKKSTVKRGDLNPTWNEVFTFKIADLAADLPVRVKECEGV